MNLCCYNHEPYLALRSGLAGILAAAPAAIIAAAINCRIEDLQKKTNNAWLEFMIPLGVLAGAFSGFLVGNCVAHLVRARRLEGGRDFSRIVSTSLVINAFVGALKGGDLAEDKMMERALLAAAAWAALFIGPVSTILSLCAFRTRSVNWWARAGMSPLTA